MKAPDNRKSTNTDAQRPELRINSDTFINQRSIAGLLSSWTRTRNIGGVTMNPTIVQVTDN